MHGHRRYLAILLAVIGALCCCAALFSVVVDPYAIFGSPLVPGWNTVKDQPDHVTKPYRVLRGDYDTVIVGSSRSRDIFCPDLAALYPGEHVRCFNAGMAHADFSMMRRMLVHADTVTPLRRAVICLDFFGFNTGYTPFNKTDAERFLGQPGRLPGAILNDVCRFLFSRGALEKAWETIRRSRPHPVQQTPKPSTPEPGVPTHVAAAIAPAGPAPKPAAHNPYVGFYPAVLHFYQNYSFANPRTGVSSLGELRDLLRYCRSRGITTYLVINPFHAVLFDVFREAGLWDRFLEWKRDVIAITAEVNAAGSGPVVALWDFSGYNAVTTESVLTRHGLRNALDYFADAFHYHRNVGALMLRRMITGEQTVPGFGRRLTPADAPLEAARLAAGHAAFARDNAGYIALVLGRDAPGSAP